MPQNQEAQAFLTRVGQLPRGPGDDYALVKALQPSLHDEAELRKLFATDKSNARLQDPYVGLVDVFDAPDDIRQTRARIIGGEDDLSARYILPLSDKQRRKEGDPAIVSSLEEFKKNWAIFSEGSLSQLTDWSNVVVAGGSVQACLMPVPDSAKTSKRAMRKYFHSNMFPTSDVDLFLYGLTPEQAEAKMQAIYEAVRDSVPWDVTCIRTKHTVSIHSQYPYRSVQIVLRLYSSPAEILAGFDVDAPCCLYDGERVWANPRAIVAMMRQCNTVDMTRRSPSYEVRLAKYSARGFEVEVPNLRRDDIDPTIYERSIVRVQGLARLIVLERLADPDSKIRYLSDRRSLRARPPAQDEWNRRRRKQMKGDLKANIDLGGLEMNDYDVQSLHIPYGPGWDARRIDKLVYQTDLGMNSPYNPKNKGRRLHRHPAFFGTMTECLEDCCECCPEPKDAEEKQLQETEDESYVRGRVQFIEENPGRQSISSSFHPIDEGEWAGQAYIGPTEKLFNAIVAGDRAALAKAIADEGTDLDRRDHVGRTPLQVAILSRQSEVACDLVEAGARMTARLVDGRTVLHLAAQLDLPMVVRKLLERSAVNAEKAEEEEAAAQAAKDAVLSTNDKDAEEAEEGDDEDEDAEEHNSSEDDWSSEDGEPKKGTDATQSPDADQIPEDENDVPDVFDVNLPDWDYAFTPLHYAVAFGSLSVMDELLAAGADASLVTKAGRYHAQALHPLTVTAITRNIDVACEAAKKLIAKGAVSSEADDNLFTILHKIVCAKRPALTETLLEHDPNARAVLDSPHMVTYRLEALFPIVSAIAKGDHATLAVLLAYGAKYVLDQEDYSRARERKARHSWQSANKDWRGEVYFPVEVSLASLDHVVGLLVDIGAEFNVDIKTAIGNRDNSHMAILDYVRAIVPALHSEADGYATRADERAERVRFREVAAVPGWPGAHAQELLKWSEQLTSYERDVKEHAEKREKYLAAIAYYREAEEILVAHGAKSAKELFEPDTQVNTNFGRSGVYGVPRYSAAVAYYKMNRNRSSEEIPTHMTGAYNELFEACRVGDTAKIQALCLPSEGKSKSDAKVLQITCTFLYNQGLTPLSMALNNRQWDAARLVLAIATAQYKPKDDKKSKFVTKSVVLEIDDSDSDSGCGSDEDSDSQPEINFVDIARRPSEVHTEVPPEKLLELADLVYHAKDNKWHSGPPLFKTVLDDDFEAFVQIADLYKALPKPVDLPADAAKWVCTFDRPTMLEELIRRTGAGIELPEVHDEHEHEDGDAPRWQSKQSSSKAYLGLNVHGKKRKDLAEKVDPNAPGTTKTSEVPLLWTAAQANAVGVMRYLASERPLAAYEYYASTHSDEKAMYLRRIKGQIMSRLGWRSNELHESAVTATVIGGHLEALKEVIALRPAEMQSALTARIHFVGFNHILVGANWGCSPELFDYLLSNGVSPTETDVRGWNVYHLICARDLTDESGSHLKLLKYVLQKLPKDVTARMLLQQSKGALNTPLHLAVKRKSLPAVRLLLPFVTSVFALRDKSGSTPLHVAVKEGLSEIARLVGDAGPAEVLHLEDGVGNTPLEIATQTWLQRETQYDVAYDAPRVDELEESIYEYEWNRKEIRNPTKKDVALLKDTIARLEVSGRLRKGTKLATALEAFAEKMEAKARAAEGEAKPATHEKPANDTRDVLKTFEYIIGAVSARAAPRGLVHLDDVQRSVKASLERSARRDETQRKREDDGLEVEVVEDDEAKLKKRSLLAQFHSAAVMPLFEADPL